MGSQRKEIIYPNRDQGVCNLSKRKTPWYVSSAHLAVTWNPRHSMQDSHSPSIGLNSSRQPITTAIGKPKPQPVNLSQGGCFPLDGHTLQEEQIRVNHDSRPTSDHRDTHSLPDTITEV